jgi:pyrimidine-nucleoside phosphorylase
MLRSGDVLDFSHVPGPKVDKHSTGGVGDKVSIPLGPLAAVCGVVVPMMSGRGLGHTGGTLDKLESIPGFRSALDPAEFRQMVELHSLVLAGQSETLVPADRLFYALRDATGTVPSIPLISSSIMSKKLAEGLDALVLDVKVGEGAFMKDLDSARTLAETMVGIGASHGVAVTALLTSMDQPLGREVGNASEIRESVDVLRGAGPDDLTELVVRLTAEMLVAGGLFDSVEDATPRVQDAIASGAGLAKLEQIVEAQDGDPAALTDWSRLPTARHSTTHLAPRSGTVTRCGALPIGVAAMRLGAGRAVAEDTVDPAAGITVLAKVGDRVSAGDALAEIAYNDDDRLQAALRLLEGAWEIEEGPVTVHPLILETIT